MVMMMRRGGELDHGRRTNGMRFRVGWRTTGTTTTDPAQGRTYRRGCTLKFSVWWCPAVIGIIGISIIISSSSSRRASGEEEAAAAAGGVVGQRKVSHIDLGWTVVRGEMVRQRQEARWWQTRRWTRPRKKKTKVIVNVRRALIENGNERVIK